ncbi:MAG: trypsin-like serine protease [Candidatus Magasanikbacteria bacterium]|nr:trypsin-like serine protease [Candidatus Magasanikbacteria bacterium]
MHESSVESTGGSLINGLPDKDNVFTAVVRVRVPGEDKKDKKECTGTLVNPSTVITATHCVCYDPSNDDYCVDTAHVLFVNEDGTVIKTIMGEVKVSKQVALTYIACLMRDT